MPFFGVFLRNKVNSIEDFNLKLAFRDEIERRIKDYRQKNNSSNNTNFNKLNYKNYTLLKQQKLPKTGVETKFEAIIFIITRYPSMCSIFNEKLSFLDFKDQSLNAMKDIVLELVFNKPKINFKDLNSELINKGFAIQLGKIMQSNIPVRLNLDKHNKEKSRIHEILKELLDLINLKLV
jgi:hypothetical protein